MPTDPSDRFPATQAARCRGCAHQHYHAVPAVQVLLINPAGIILWESVPDERVPPLQWVGWHIADVTHPEDQDLPPCVVESVCHQGVGTLFLCRDHFAVQRWWLVECLPATGVTGDAAAVVKMHAVCTHFFSLSPTERAVLARLATGWAVTPIARDLGMSPNTCRTHLQRAGQKLGVLDRAELLRWCLGHLRVLAYYRGAQWISPPLGDT